MRCQTPGISAAWALLRVAATKTVVASVGLGDGQGDLLALALREGASGERAAQSEVAGERGVRPGHREGEVRCHAQLATHRLELLPGPALGFSGIHGFDSGHGLLLLSWVEFVR